jgi:uncharacterized membrane protein YgcG
MILLLIFLLIFIVILLVGQFSRPTNRKIRNHRRIRDNTGSAQTDQSLMPPLTHTNEWWLHSNTHIPLSHTDNIVPSDSTSGNHAHELPVVIVDSSVNTSSIDTGSSWDSGGSIDSSSGSDFGGFSGGGGDAGGGGAGGEW